ncbi:B3 domain-containing protein Os01g0234100-like isoform X2 [Lotus japonicus]|nr:B3 domain-containing protein Os01g0234100-like isoform X2 [Lotus japonicus]
MHPSHVSGAFWLSLSTKFCQMHLPKADTIITLEDESGELYETKYIADKVALSGGWMRFSIAHNLHEMDVLIFHLVKPSKFKVYIVRSQGSDEVDGALGMLKLDKCRKTNDEVSSVLDTTRGNDPRMIFGDNLSQSDQLENESKDLFSETSESVINSFEQVTGIENFIIMVNGLVIYSELSERLWVKYYELCRSQRCFLHDNLVSGLNSKLVVGMITETINIADAIKASKVTTSMDNFVTWDKTLKAFEGMGMNVSFLITQLDHLMKLALKLKRHKEARLERLHANEKLKALEARVLEVKKTIRGLDEEIAMEDMNPERVETMFQELVNAPW